MVRATTTEGKTDRRYKADPEGVLVPLHSRVSEQERKALAEAAHTAGVSLAPLVRSILREWLAARASNGAPAP